MRAEELAERSHATAAGNDRAVLAVLAGAGDAGVQPGGELSALARLPERTAREVLCRLVNRGLARRDGKRRVWATDAGRREAGAGTPGLSLAPTLDVALGCLPAEALRAFARLQLAAVVARWHLASEHAAGWPGFIATGPTRTGKTSIASLVCRVFRIDEVRAIKLAQYETPGSLFGRRQRDRTSPTGYRLERSPALDLPVVCLDELDKAPREVKAAAGGLLQGNSVAELEGELVKVRPITYTTLNGRRDGLGALHEAHVRRSCVIDTTKLRFLLGDVDESMARLFGGEVAIPSLSLARIKPPASALPGDLRQLLRCELRAGLTEEGWQYSDVEPLARIALGRAALTNEPLDERAVIGTVFDYLVCSTTLHQTEPGFVGRLASRLGARGALCARSGRRGGRERAAASRRARPPTPHGRGAPPIRMGARARRRRAARRARRDGPRPRS